MAPRPQSTKAAAVISCPSPIPELHVLKGVSNPESPEREMAAFMGRYPGLEPAATLCDKDGSLFLLVDESSLFRRSDLMGDVAASASNAARHLAMLRAHEAAAASARRRRRIAESSSSLGGESHVVRVGASAGFAALGFGVVTELFMAAHLKVSDLLGVEGTAAYRVAKWNAMKALRDEHHLCGPLFTPSGRPYWAHHVYNEIKWPLLIGAIAYAAYEIEEAARRASRRARREGIAADPAVRRMVAEARGMGLVKVRPEELARMTNAELLAAKRAIEARMIEIAGRLDEVSGEQQRDALAEVVLSYGKLGKEDVAAMGIEELAATADLFEEEAEREGRPLLGKVGEWIEVIAGVGAGFGIGVHYAKWRLEYMDFSARMARLAAHAQARAHADARAEVRALAAKGTLKRCDGAKVNAADLNAISTAGGGASDLEEARSAVAVEGAIPGSRGRTSAAAAEAVAWLARADWEAAGRTAFWTVSTLLLGAATLILAAAAAADAVADPLPAEIPLGAAAAWTAALTRGTLGAAAISASKFSK